MGVRGAIHQPLGIDSALFSPRWRNAALRRHLGLPPDAPLLVRCIRHARAAVSRAADRRRRPSGLPVVATNGGAVAELVDDSTGVLVRPNCPRSMAEGTDALYRRDLAQLALAARSKASELYDWNTIMPQLTHRRASLLALRERAELVSEMICVPE